MRHSSICQLTTALFFSAVALSSSACEPGAAPFDTSFVDACTGLTTLRTVQLTGAELGRRANESTAGMVELESQFGEGSQYAGIDIKVRLFGPPFPSGTVQATVLPANTAPRPGTAVVIFEAAGPAVDQDGDTGEVTFNGRGTVTIQRPAQAPEPGQTWSATANVTQWVHTETEEGADTDFLRCGTNALQTPTLQTITTPGLVLPQVSVESF